MPFLSSTHETLASRKETAVMESAQIQRWKGELHLFQTRCINESIGALYAGSRFTGEQRSGRCNYSVKVEIQHVDLRQSTLCGYLHIQGLTSENPELTTFFDAEIIGPRYSFLTRKWDAKEQIDRQHWNKFPAWRVYDSTFNDDGFEYTWKNKDYIFMRWKEHFLLPDHRIQTITGAVWIIVVNHVGRVLRDFTTFVTRSAQASLQGFTTTRTRSGTSTSCCIMHLKRPLLLLNSDKQCLIAT
jgi:hypothetical protein